MARYDMDSANSENSEGTDKEQDDFPKPYLIQKKFDSDLEEGTILRKTPCSPASKKKMLNSQNLLVEVKIPTNRRKSSAENPKKSMRKKFEKNKCK